MKKVKTEIKHLKSKIKVLEKLEKLYPGVKIISFGEIIDEENNYEKTLFYQSKIDVKEYNKYAYNESYGNVFIYPYKSIKIYNKKIALINDEKSIKLMTFDDFCMNAKVIIHNYKKYTDSFNKDLQIKIDSFVIKTIKDNDEYKIEQCPKYIEKLMVFI